MKFVAIADLHGMLPDDVPACDVLLIAGDVCPVVDHSIDRQQRWLTGEFTDWLRAQKAEVIIGIAGNHDFAFERIPHLGACLPWVYLQDETVRINQHLIHGSPWTPPFLSWAFMLPEEQLAERWKLVPDDTTILMTHGPMYGVGDRTTDTGEYVGSVTLAARIEQLTSLRLHLFGHIHEERGRGALLGHASGRADWANVSFVNLEYQPYGLSYEEFDL